MVFFCNLDKENCRIEGCKGELGLVKGIEVGGARNICNLFILRNSSCAMKHLVHECVASCLIVPCLIRYMNHINSEPCPVLGSGCD